MGANSFMATGQGGTVGEAFADAVGQYGSGDGYTGTVAEKDGHVVIQSAPAADEDAAADIADRLLDDGDPRVMDKWGPAGAIRYTDPDAPDLQSWLFFGMASS